MFGGLGVQELLVIFLIILLLFGAKRIPEIAKGLGRGISDFKKAMKSASDEVTKPIEEHDSVTNSDTKADKKE
jgi:sec-independent protein translocase protein TatA